MANPQPPPESSAPGVPPANAKPLTASFTDLSEDHRRKRLELRAKDHRPSPEGERLLELVDEGADLAPVQRMMAANYRTSKEAHAEAVQLGLIDPEPPPTAA